MADKFACPVCGSTDTWRDEVDIGVGIQYGPWRCEACGSHNFDELSGIFKDDAPNNLATQRMLAVFSNLLKMAVMSPLQTTVVGLGVCPHCHERTLVRRHESLDCAFDQCRECKRVFVIDVAVTSDAGGS